MVKKDQSEERLLQINHDIKSSVMSIKAYSQLLLKKTKPILDPSLFHYLLRLDNRIDNLIDELRKWNDLHKSPPKTNNK